MRQTRLVILVVSIALAIACNLGIERHGHSADMRCLLTNQKFIGLALSSYAREHDGRLPDNLSDLSKKGYLLDRTLLHCPARIKADRTVDYELERISASEDGKDLLAVLYDKPGNHREPGRFLSVFFKEPDGSKDNFYLEGLGFASESQFPIVIRDLKEEHCLKLAEWRKLLRWDL